MQVFYVLSRTVIWGLKYLLPQSHEECADEEPVHEVYLDDYLVDRDEISVAQYRGVEAGICLEPARGEACNWGRRPRHRLI